MSDRSGGIISKTPPSVTAPTLGEGGSASGIWTLDDVVSYEKTSGWPKGILPRSFYVWGRNFLGSLGLGDSGINRSSPVQLGSETNWEHIASGRHMSVASKRDGTIYTWGRGSKGATGQNSETDISSPVQVGALTNWGAVTAGYLWCASIKTDGTLWAWGRNNSGQVGDGTTTYRSSPVQVGVETNWSIISGGASHCLGIKTDGTLWGWGQDNFGQAAGTYVPGNSRVSPIQIGSSTNWTDCAGGQAHSMVINSDNKIYLWGANYHGALGNNSTSNSYYITQLGSLTNWAQVDGHNSTFAVKTDGTMWSWGRNQFGRLGQNDTIYTSSPNQMGSLTNWSYVQSGPDVSAAIKTDGTLWAWGANGNGMVGNNDNQKVSSPVQVGSGTNWYKISPRGYSTLGIERG